jgi:hypothetical protein
LDPKGNFATYFATFDETTSISCNAVMLALHAGRLVIECLAIA